MSTRVDSDGSGAAAQLALQPLPATEALPPLGIDPDDRFEGPALPSDHPAWMRDAVALSQRARALIEKLRPVVVRVVAVWEHRVRTIVVGGRTVKVDASGSYRME